MWFRPICRELVMDVICSLELLRVMCDFLDTCPLRKPWYRILIGQCHEIKATGLHESPQGRQMLPWSCPNPQWTFLEQEINFCYIKPLKFQGLFAAVPQSRL